MKIVFLHTSDAHIKRFDNIARGLHKKVDIHHHVNEELLTIAQQTGTPNKTLFNNTITQIRAEHSGKIICTCSTYGHLCNEANNVYRIDKPIAEWIVTNYNTIGVAFTTHSTSQQSKALLQEIANSIEKTITITAIDCTHCWQWFEKGDLEQYAQAIAHQIKQKIKQSSDACEVIFLAQASMEAAQKYLTNERYKTVSSPQYGVKHYLMP